MCIRDSINPDFTAIQKSVFECALAGCSTIWIVANDDLAPIVRKIIGEWIYDPVYYRGISKFSSEERKEIPIYYVPIHPKDANRRDSYGWSVLYGIYTAWKVANNVSRWIEPDKYYVSFPMSVYDIYQVRSHRRLIADPKNNFFLTFDGQTVKDNIPLSFTMMGEDFKRCRKSVNKKTTKEYLPPLEGQQYPSKKIPLKDRWSARYFKLEDVFEDINDEGAHAADVSWYYDISKWSGYRAFLRSENSIETPEAGLTKPRQHVKIPYKEEG